MIIPPVSGDPRRIVVAGAGLAGLRAVENLRREGFDGRITLVGDEPDPPYDRPPLSKEILVGTREPDTLVFRPPEKLAELGVEVILGSAAGVLDLEERTVDVEGTPLPFDGLILATGAGARTLTHLDGKPGVRTLRTLRDSLALRDELAHARRLVVVGAGFIGSEAAASARARGVEVTIVELEERPLSRVLGPELSDATAGLHRDHGTELRLGVTANDVVDGVVQLSDGTSVEADLVLIGIGAFPHTAWLEGSGLEIANGVVCDASLNAGFPGVYAIGDIASWANELFGRRMRVEHWTNAAEQGRHVARALVHGHDEPFLGSNYVWSDQYGVRIQFVGLSAPEVHVISGSIEERKFLAWYRQDDRLVGALAMATPRPLMQTKLLIERRLSWDEALAAAAEFS
jgi:NADPH-dependent 2,4-dienoyl-CoA reductase/sulfur reductase-like enzyme